MIPKSVYKRTLFTRLRLGATMAALTFACPSALLAQYAVSGTKITNGGAEFIVKGTNIEGQNTYYWRDCSNDAAITKAWGFNTIRIRCYMGNPYAGVPNYNPQVPRTKQWLYEMIDKYRAAGVVVMICVHDLTGAYPTATSVPTLNQLRDYFVDLAIRYKADTGVWFNPINEPGNNGAPYWEGVDPQWESAHNTIITAIRNAGNNSIVMVDGHLWGQDCAGWDNNNVAEWRSAILSKGVAVLNNDPRKNIVFSNHYYDQWEMGDSNRIRDYMARIAAKGLCLVVGEYGSNSEKNAAGSYNMPGRYSTLTTNLLTVCRERSVGRIVWAWDASDYWDLVNYTAPTSYTYNGGGWEIDRRDGVKPANLSWLGEQVWADNRYTPPAPVAATPAATNLVTNPSFESGQLSPWSSWNSAAALSVVTGMASEGQYSLRVLGNSGGQISLTGFTKGKTYTFTASGRLFSADGSNLYITITGNGFSQSLAFTTNSYATKQLTFTAPADLNWLQVQTWKTPGAMGYVDNISVR